MDKDAVSSDLNNRTLRDIFSLLQSRITDFTSESESLAQLSRRRPSFMSDHPKPVMTKSKSHPGGDHLPIETKSSTEKASRELVERQHLDILRENILYKETLQNVTREIDNMHKRLRQSCTNIDDDDMQELANTRKLLENFAVSQKNSEKKLDKICSGIAKILKIREEAGQTLCPQEMTSIPMELADICEYIHAKGYNSLQLASKLGITEGKLNLIELQYEDEEERLKRVLYEWSTGCQIPKVSTLVKVCSELNPSILTVSPLSKQDTKVLERNMAFLIEEMMEVSLLIPYLTADGILSLRSGKYIIEKRTRPERIMALLDILSTNERGLDAFISALQKTDQCHISQRLQDFRQYSEDTESDASDFKNYEQGTIVSDDKSETEDKDKPFSKLPETVKEISTTQSEDILQHIVILLKKAGYTTK